MGKTKILKEGWGAAPNAFYVSAMPKREAMPGEKVHCGIYRRKPGSPRPQFKQHSSISIPKEIFDGHLQTGVYRIG